MTTICLDHLKSLVFISGLSGAGRSTALDAVSDLGFFTNENLPIGVCEAFLKHTKDNPNRYYRTALAPDVESNEKVQEFLAFIKQLGHPDNKVQSIFLDCRPEIILKRYGQTRRPHPSFDPNLDLSLEDAISRERARLSPVRDGSNFVIDTSEMNLHELRKEINTFITSLGSRACNLVRVNIIAFGFKHGVPNDCDILNDVRFLPNPFFVPELKDKTGLDQEVKDFVLKKKEAEEFLGLTLSQLEFMIKKHADSGKLYLNIGVGCTGGRHRSVCLAKELVDRLEKTLDKDRFSLSLRNRDIFKAI